jgi:hypothetical protein
MDVQATAVDEQPTWSLPSRGLDTLVGTGPKCGLQIAAREGESRVAIELDEGRGSLGCVRVFSLQAGPA